MNDVYLSKSENIGDDLNVLELLVHILGNQTG